MFKASPSTTLEEQVPGEAEGKHCADSRVHASLTVRILLWCAGGFHVRRRRFPASKSARAREQRCPGLTGMNWEPEPMRPIAEPRHER